jgi:hypothetical protein
MQQKPVAPIRETSVSFMETVMPIPEKPSPLPQWQWEGEGEPVIAEPIALSRPDEPMEKEIAENQPPNIEKPIKEGPKVNVSAHEPEYPVMPENVARTLSAIQDLTPHEAFAYALEDIKKTINAEFSAIRTELRLWRKGQ